MKIATWNLERLEKRKNDQIISKLVEINADILVLTETNSIIKLGGYRCISTHILPTYFDGITYKEGENRVSIFTKYEVSSQHKTFDSYTTVCTDIKTPFGMLTVYGSIIGVFGNRQPRFDTDLNGHLSDFQDIFPYKQVCLSGDLNTTFSGQAWPSKKARQILLNAFEKHKLTNTTSGIPNTVDHIILSTDFMQNKYLQIETWNTDKALSDHVGHLLTLTEQTNY